MKLKIEVTSTERTMIVAALIAYGSIDMANRIADIDPADDGSDAERLLWKSIFAEADAHPRKPRQ